MNYKILFIVCGFLFLLSLGSVFAESNDSNNYSPSQFGDIYVDSSVNRSGDGSLDNPLNNVKDAVNLANNGSYIYIKGGKYLTENNSQIFINKNVTLESYDGEVIFTGIYKNYVFKIDSGVSVVLKGITFKNIVYEGVQSYAPITNNGDLTINNCNFENSSGLRSGVILNEAKLLLVNSTFVKNNAKYYGGALSNFNNTKIVGCLFDSNIAPDASAVLNSHDMAIYDSIFIGNDLKSSKYMEIESILGLEDSYFYENSSIMVVGSGASIKQSYIRNILVDNSIVDICYSFIYCYSFINSELVLDSNLWYGYQDIPKEANDWLVMSFTDLDGNDKIKSKEDCDLLVCFKIYDGKKYLRLLDSIRLPSVRLNFASDNGVFEYNEGILTNNIFRNHYSKNIKDTKLFVSLEDYSTFITVGKGYDADIIHVSNMGSDSLGDGSIDNPYKTINHAVSVATNGNEIHIRAGVYNNSVLDIDKELIFVGYGGEVILIRGGNDLFTVTKKGKLTIQNITLTVSNLNNYSKLIVNNGETTIINCLIKDAKGGDITFTKNNFPRYYIPNQALILTNGNLHIFNSSFENLENIAIRSPFTSSAPIEIIIDYCNFTKCNAKIWEMMVASSEIYNDEYSTSAIISCKADNLIINHCNFCNNDATAILSVSKNIIVNNTFFNMNKASILNFGKGTVENTIITNDDGPFLNYGTGNVMPIVKGITNYRNVSFIKNNHLLLGGGYESGKSINLYNCSFNSNNYTTYQLFDDFRNAARGIIQNNGIMNVEYCIFESNYASQGGVFYNTGELDLVNDVFVNNFAEVGNVVLMKSGRVHTSDCWWGSNQGPNNDEIFKVAGDLTIKNWAVLSLEFDNGYLVAGFNQSTDDYKNFYNLNGIIPYRTAIFGSDEVYISPNKVIVKNNLAKTLIKYAGEDISAYVIVDNQKINLTFYNRNTIFVIEDVAFYGIGNTYEVILKSVNGYSIINQSFLFQLINSAGIVVNQTIKTDSNGHASIPINVSMGNYTVNVNYAGNNYFKPTSKTAWLEVLPYETVINIKSFQKLWGNKNFLYAYLYDNFGDALVNQTVIFNITDDSNKEYCYRVGTDSFGQAGIYLTIPEGNYKVSVIFEGDEWHYGAENSGTFTVVAIETQLLIEQSTFYGRGNVLTVLLRDANYRPIYNETIHITFISNGRSEEYAANTNIEGRAGVIINLIPGNYVVIANYNGDDLNGKSSTNSDLNIEKVEVLLSADKSIVFDNSNNMFNVKLTDKYGRLLENETVIFSILSQTAIKKSFRVVTDDNGIATVEDNLDLGNYIVKVDFNDNYWYYSTDFVASLIVKDYFNGFDPYASILSVNDLYKYYKNNTQFSATLTDIYSVPIVNAKISIIINGAEYKRTTNELGQVSLNINLEPGVYNIRTVYNSTGLYSSCFADSKITVLSQIITSNLTKVYKNDTPFILKFVDNNGNPIKGKSVKFNINGIIYSRITNEGGFAKLNINLGSGNYILTSYVDNFAVSNKIVIIPQLKTEDLMMYYKDGSKFKASIRGSDGKFKVNETIKFTINGVTYYKKTNNNGIAALSINLDSGLYSIIAEYGEFVNKNDIFVFNMAVNIHITTQTVSKGSVFEAKLTDVNGNAIVSKEVVFKINGILYKRVTNETGHVKLNINLNSGIYAIITAFSIRNYQDKVNYNTLHVTSNY